MKRVPGKKKSSKRQVNLTDGVKVCKYDVCWLTALVFFLSGVYFYFFGNYIFFYQENQSLFIFSSGYLRQYASKPGGLLEYAGIFLSQGYFNIFYGAFILSVIFASIALVFMKISKKLSPGSSFSLFFAAIASCLLILMQTDFFYMIHNNLGFLLAGLYLLIAISSDSKVSRLTILLLFPVFFYIAGAYAWLFLGMFILHSLLRGKLIYSVSFLTFSGVTLIAFKRIIFLEPWSQLLYYPLPSRDNYTNPQVIWILILFFVLYPLLVVLSGLIKPGKRISRYISTVTSLFVIVVTIICMSRNYSKDTAEAFFLEKMFFEHDWDGVIRHQEENQYKNLVSQYYYNTALSENGMMCERMFFAPQDFGSNGIMIPWSSEISMNRIFRGVYFYYSIGLINEVHRWAFESMVIQGYRPENIKLLIKTNLINGHYKVAEKYIGILKRTLRYRGLASRYEAMVKDPELIKSDPELGEKLKLKPHDDFLVRIRNPEENIISLSRSNPANRKAFEYKMAYFMLNNDIEGVVNEVDRLAELGYTKIPRHIEEAVLLFEAAHGPLQGMGSLKISDETESRFSKYILTMTMDRPRSAGGNGIEKDLRSTYWYYLDSGNPGF